MTVRIAVGCALLFCSVFAETAIAQPGDRYLNMKARVLNVIFPLDVAPKPYFLRVILRFSDSDTQLVAVIYPDKEKYWVGRCEITRYAIAGLGKGQLSQLISTMLAENPKVDEQEIAAKLKVNVRRFPIAPETLNHSLKELKAVRIPPILADRVAVDEYSEYEYWYDNWQESVHYTLTGPSKNTPQDKLVQWMIKFRAKISDMATRSFIPTPKLPPP